MRSSKRSRGKQNRTRNNNPGNIINRVFDSSGPEGKVRGTPQQIIDKYSQLARDAALGNDRVAAENFQQHAEHYTRLLAEAQREVDARRAAADEQNRQRQQQQREEREAREMNRAERRDSQRGEEAAVLDLEGDQPQTEPQSAMDLGGTPQPELGGDVIDAPEDADSGLVETPESKPKKRVARPRKPREPEVETKVEAKPKAKPKAKPRAKTKAGDAANPADGPETPEAAE